MLIKKIKSLFKKEKIEDRNEIKPNIPGTNKSVRKGELGEYKINIQLDQLPKNCKFLSDLLLKNNKSKTGYSQLDHVVISPYGIFVIETKNYVGEIRGKKGDTYWRVNNRFNMYNPLLQNYGHIKALQLLMNELGDSYFISMISFTMRCRFNVDPELRKISSNQLIVYDTELTEFINRKISVLSMGNKQSLLDSTKVNEVYNRISEANITDQRIRMDHNQMAARNKEKDR